MIKVYTGIKGLAVFLLITVGVIFFFSIFFWGVTKVIQLFLPLLIAVSYLLIIVFLLGVLTAVFLKEVRPFLGKYSVWMSNVLAFFTWIMAFFFVISTFRLGGVFFVPLFQFLAPIALLLALFKGTWPIAAHLSVWIGFTYGMRSYSQWLLNLNPHDHEGRRIIDVDVIEVKGQ